MRSSKINVAVCSTDASLIERLRNPRDTSAMEEFMERYVPTIRRWAEQFGAQPAEADDVTQNVCLALLKALRSFNYDRQKGRFRGWLWTVTKNAWGDYARKSLRDAAVGLPSTPEWLAGIPDSSLSDNLANLFDQELLEIAIARTRSEFSEASWLVFEMRVLQELSAREVSTNTGIAVGTIHVMKGRFEKRLKAIVEELDGDHLGSDAAGKR